MLRAARAAAVLSRDKHHQVDGYYLSGAGYKRRCWYTTEGLTLAPTTTLSAAGGTIHWLQVVAVRELVLERPDVWGRATSLESPRRQSEKLSAELDALLRKIEIEASFAGLDQEPVPRSLRDDGYCRLRFKLWPTVFFGEGFAERLVDSELADRPSAPKAETYIKTPFGRFLPPWKSEASKPVSRSAQ